MSLIQFKETPIIITGQTNMSVFFLKKKHVKNSFEFKREQTMEHVPRRSIYFYFLFSYNNYEFFY